MKITIEKAVNSKVALDELLVLDLDGSIGFTIFKNKKAVMELIEYYNSKLREIYNKYCEKDDKGKLVYDPEKNMYKINELQSEQFFKEINKLLATSFDINIKPIPVQELFHNKLKPYIFENLDYMLVDNSQNETEGDIESDQRNIKS